MIIGILALQGAFAEHAAKLEQLNAHSFEIRQRKDIERYMDGLILPGGESTVMGKLLHKFDLFTPIQNLIAQGLPVLGTCAGMILLARKINNDDHTYFAGMDITVDRNAYGRQLGSFTAQANFNGGSIINMPFIRAPRIVAIGPNVTVLARFQNDITAVREGSQLACAFHPELAPENTVHEYFLNMIAGGQR